MEIRSLQIGLSGIAVEKYVSEWILEIQDITPICTDIRHLIADGKIDQAMKILPIETIYPLPENIGKRIGASD
jgi:pre-mRNA-splicing factor ATP-dependent RNA helicase DHX16